MVSIFPPVGFSIALTREGIFFSSFLFERWWCLVMRWGIGGAYLCKLCAGMQKRGVICTRGEEFLGGNWCDGLRLRKILRN